MEDDEVSLPRSKDQKKIEMPMISEGNHVISMAPKSKGCYVCVFFEKANTTLESKERQKSATKLSGLIIFYLIVLFVEIIGGVRANSLAVMTYATHLITDVDFSIYLFTLWASAWKPTSYQSFGFNRIEVLSTLVSLQLIWLISTLLIYDTIDRILHKNDELLLSDLLSTWSWLFGWVATTLTMLVVESIINYQHHHHNHHHDHDRAKSIDLIKDNETSLVTIGSKTNKILNINIHGA